MADDNKVKTNSFENHQKVEKNHLTKAIFIVHDGKIIDANIVELFSDNYSEKDLEENFIKIVQNRKDDFSGHINVNSIDKMPYNNWGIINGKTVSSTVLKRGTDKVTNNNTQTNSTCTDWYWVTTYHWSDGTQTQTWDFIATTCWNEEDFPPQGEISTLPLDSLCAQSKRLASDFSFKNKMTDLKNRLGEAYETGYAKYGNSYTFIQGTSAGVSVAGLPTGIDAIFHTHLTNLEQTFSLVDFNQLYQYLVVPGYINNPSGFMFGVVLPNQQIQLIRITDMTAFTAFGNANLLDANFGAFQSNVAYLFNNATTYDQRTAALMKAMQGSGLTFYEGDANSLNSGFQRIEPSTDPLISIIRTKCNN